MMGKLTPSASETLAATMARVSRKRRPPSVMVPALSPTRCSAHPSRRQAAPICQVAARAPFAGGLLLTGPVTGPAGVAQARVTSPRQDLTGRFRDLRPVQDLQAVGSAGPKCAQETAQARPHFGDWVPIPLACNPPTLPET